jgi:hypothetical protein
MTHEVKIGIERDKELPDMFAWLDEHKQQHIVDWRWFKPDYFRNVWCYTFQFEDEQIANWFALRWV